MNGRSQAVRLPKAYRFPGSKVFIHRQGDAVILEPYQEPNWPAGYFDQLAALRQGLDLDALERPSDPPPAPLQWELDA